MQFDILRIRIKRLLYSLCTGRFALQFKCILLLTTCYKNESLCGCFWVSVLVLFYHGETARHVWIKFVR